MKICLQNLKVSLNYSSNMNIGLIELLEIKKRDKQGTKELRSKG